MKNNNTSANFVANLTPSIASSLRTKNPDSGVSMVSSFGLASVLLPILCGAKGETERQVQQLLFPHLSTIEAAKAVANMVKAINAIEDTDVFKISSDSAIWVTPDVDFCQNYLEVLDGILGTHHAKLGFGDNARAVQVINDWFKQQIVSTDLITSDTVLVAANLSKIIADWEFGEFDDVCCNYFHPESGDKQWIQMMSKKGVFKAIHHDDYTIVELPLSGPATVLAVLPKEHKTVSEVESTFSPAMIEDLYAAVQGQRKRRMKVEMPEIEAEAEIDAIPILQALGVQDIFGDCDLSGMTDCPNKFKISVLKQKIKTRVNAVGIIQEAASVAAVETESIYIPDTDEVPTISFTRPYFLKTLVEIDKQPVEYFSMTVHDPKPPKK